MGFKNSQNFITLLKGTLILGIPIALLYVYNYSNVDLSVYGYSIKKITPESEETLTASPSIGTVRATEKQTEIAELDFVESPKSEKVIPNHRLPIERKAEA